MASKYKPVVQNFIRTADKIYQLTYEDGTVIETTWSHPFYIEWANWKAAARSTNCEAVLQVFGWVKAEELRAGDVSKTDKGTLRIAKVHVDPRSEEVYNFEVAENHTYLVTDQGVVVHNAGPSYSADRAQKYSDAFSAQKKKITEIVKPKRKSIETLEKKRSELLEERHAAYNE
ncbi:MAG: hypothetical protein KDK23_13110 [Leptospiraceae bacterium]|nr:hypothetical protein [Leptospiraceae bacterium]